MSMIPTSLKPLSALALIVALGTAYSPAAHAHRVIIGGGDYGAFIGYFDDLYGGRHHKRHYGHYGRDYHRGHHYKRGHHRDHHRRHGYGRHHYKGHHHHRGHHRRHY